MTDCSTSTDSTAACTCRETSSNACRRATCCCKSMISAWLLWKEEVDIGSRALSTDLLLTDILQEVETVSFMETKVAIPAQSKFSEEVAEWIEAFDDLVVGEG